MNLADRPTPRTKKATIDNADMFDWGTGQSCYVHVDDMAALEREHAALREALHNLRLYCLSPKAAALSGIKWPDVHEQAASVLAATEPKP